MDNNEQQRIWEAEHACPTVLEQMDRTEPSSGVTLFVDWLKEHQGKPLAQLKGVEMNCGKGRNGIFLAEQEIEMESFDFSENAIAEAERRRASAGVERVHFFVHDATKPWPFHDDAFDVGLDVFGSTDIVSEEGRAFAVSEFLRVLKPGGFLLLYLLSTDDAFHADMIKKYPVNGQPNAFTHPQTGKFEKSFDEQEITQAYAAFESVEMRRVEKAATFFGKEYACKYFWMIFRKPANLR